MMNPEIKALWIDALRSGDYTQARGTLRETDREGNTVGYCCLGVLTELAVEAGVATRKGRADGSPNTCTYYHSANNPEEWGENSGLLRSVREWAGMEDSSGTLTEEVVATRTYHNGYEEVSVDDSYNSLIGLNDSAGYTFAQIADVIEAQF